MPEHVLVTGGAGFIGTHLINELNEHGYETSSVDLPKPGVEMTLANSADAFFDLRDEGAFEAHLDWLEGMGTPVERVVHLAAQVGRLFGEDDLRHTVRSNAELTTLVAWACGKRQIPMLYSSSSEIYGDQGNQLCHEFTTPVMPHNLYGLSKRWAEEACHLYNSFDLDIVRLSMPYGPGAPPGRGRRAMDNFLWQANHGMEIPVHKGSERSWCWVGDTVRAIRMIIEHRYSKSVSSRMEDHMPQAWNVGRDDDARPLRDVAEIAVQIAGASADLIKDVEPPAAQTVVKRLATDKIRKLGWEPTIELEEGMPLLWEWIKQFDETGRKRDA